MKKLIVVKKPASIVKKQAMKKSLDLVWPDILTYVQQHPKTTNEHLFNLFGERAGETSLQCFGRKCNLRGLRELKRTCQGKSAIGFKESQEITRKTIDNFKKDRLDKGVLHLTKMDVMMNNVHKVLEKESNSVVNEEKDNVGIGLHLAHLNQAHRLAKDVYRIDAAENGSDSKTNLAIILNFDPGKPTDRDKAKIIDV
jgi:hypothetical protein